MRIRVWIFICALLGLVGRCGFYAVFFLSSGAFAQDPPVAHPPNARDGSKPLQPIAPSVPVPSPSSSPSPNTLKKTSTKLIPLPIYATLPNEGSTFGLMAVFVKVDEWTHRTDSIYAPSISWNSVIGETGTMRWYHYPAQDQALTFTASASTRYNWGGVVLWENEPFQSALKTETISFRAQRSVFFRFFGLGPDREEGGESSHTRIRGDLWYRRGWNIAPYLNLGVRAELAKDVIQSDTVPNYPLSPSAFPGVAGMSGGAALSEAVDIRYDTRDARNYSLRGVLAQLAIGPAQGLGSSPGYWIGNFETRVLFPEISWLSGGARLFARYVTSPQVPFYYQSSLGGSFFMRGFTEDRFIDQGAWTAEFEQRLRVFQTHIYGVTTDWRIDPFVAVGQVFHPGTGFFSNVRVTEGIGFRAFVRPNVLGRVDIATGGEGAKFYVELGYPF